MKLHDNFVSYLPNGVVLGSCNGNIVVNAIVDGGNGIMYDESFGFGAMFTIVPMMIGLIFIVVIGLIIKQVIGYAADKQKPVIPVKAKILTKRTHVWGEHSHTTYFATFELTNGERMELEIPDNRIGYMIEGDHGTLSFQGQLFVSFQKE